jgi:hypothetical protein
MKKVAGAGFEPAKPVGRQIYSLLVLATHPPRHITGYSLVTARERIRTATLPITNRLRYHCATRAFFVSTVRSIFINPYRSVGCGY